MNYDHYDDLIDPGPLHEAGLQVMQNLRERRRKAFEYTLNWFAQEAERMARELNAAQAIEVARQRSRTAKQRVQGSAEAQRDPSAP